MVMFHLKSILSSHLHCCYWKFVSDFYSSHGENVLTFAPLADKALSKEWPEVCERSVQNRVGKRATFGNFPSGRCSGHRSIESDIHRGSSDFLLDVGRFVVCIQRSSRESKCTGLFGRVTAVLFCRVFARLLEDRRRKPTESPQTH